MSAPQIPKTVAELIRVDAPASAARTALGLGSVATHDASEFDVAGSATAVASSLATHTSDTANPHAVTAAQVGSYTTGQADTLLGAKSPLAGSTSIVTVGTIATGAWQGSPIGVAYLGSGTPSAGKYLDGGGSWTTLPASGTGTVTSVGLTVPGVIFTSPVSGSPVTTSGTLALALATQAANVVFAGPGSGSAATPTFRALVAADIPQLAHSSLSGLTTGDPHTQYALLAGRSGGQTLAGATASGGNLTLQSTAHATKGNIYLNGTDTYFDATGALVFPAGFGATPYLYSDGGAPVFGVVGGAAKFRLLPFGNDIWFQNTVSGTHYFSGYAGADIGGDVRFVLGGTTGVRIGSGFAAAPRARLDVVGNTASTPGLIVQGAASQSANAHEWRDSSGNPLSTVSENGYFTTRRNSAPADAELTAGEAAWWFDSTNGAARLVVKGKTANGTVVSGSFNLT